MLVLKLDFHKAFDTINWECILLTLHHRGFDSKWINWIRTILTSGKTQIIMNGAVGDQISFKRGVRQGDPLSPYLFILVAAILQKTLQCAHTDGLILHPLDIQETPPTLQYADATLILLKGSVKQAMALKELLDSFAIFSGLKINYHKSTLVPIHMSQQEAVLSASTLQCPLSSLPCNYLGLPLSTNKIPHSLLQPIIDKIDRRLAGWIPGLLSWGGRVIMLNSVISAIPTYYMSCIKWPERSIEAIDKIRRAFLWKGDKEIQGGQCLVAWTTVTLPKEQGGLGLRDLRIHNKALIMKLTGKLLSNSTEPCFNWLRRRYIRSHIPVKPRQGDTTVWKMLAAVIETITHMTKVIIGDGKTTSFWKDLWTSAGRLYLRFPTLFTYATNPNCTVNSQFVDNDWQVSLHPVLSHQALLENQALFHSLLGQHITHGIPDRRVITSTMLDIKTSDIYRILSFHGLKWKASDYVWHSSIPHRYRIFLWLAFRGKLNTKDNMVKKHWITNPHCDNCPTIETIDHIILRCKAADHLWKILGLTTDANSATDMFEFVERVSTKSMSYREVWPICFAACAHALWRMRNKRVFLNKESRTTELLCQIKDYIGLWSYRTKTEYQDSLRQWCHLLL